MPRTIRISLLTALALLALTVTRPAMASGAEQKDEVRVTVKYAGKGTVNANHRIWVWLFTTPDISAGAIPIAEESLDENGATAVFAGVGRSPVYVAIAFDEGGGFLGQAPPPPGSPVALYGVMAATDAPQPVTPGPKGAISVTFDDSQRMP